MNEDELYPHILAWIEGHLRLKLEETPHCTHNHVAMNVSSLNWFEGEGRWMRPDLAFVHVFKRKFDTVPTLDLHTFEVKTSEADLLPALHQTLAHGRLADFVYLVAPEEAHWTGEVISQAQRFGVGLVRFSTVQLFDSYEQLSSAKRQSANPDLRNQFLNAALTNIDRTEQVVSWLR